MAEKIIYTMKDLDSPPKSKEDWKDVCTRERLSESFIREHTNDVYWPCVSIYQAKWISIDFAIKSGEIIWYLEEFVDKMTSKCWDTVCWRQSLSEDFMNRHYKNLNWEYVSRFQVFSTSFLSRFKCRLDLEVLSKRTDLPFLVRC